MAKKLPTHNPEVASDSYDDYLTETLKDQESADAFLSAAFEEEDYRVILLALRNVAEARGITNLARASGLNRENIYRMLSDFGNPRLSSFKTLLKALGIELEFKTANCNEHTVFKTHLESTDIEQRIQEIDFDYPTHMSSFFVTGAEVVYGNDLSA